MKFRHLVSLVIVIAIMGQQFSFGTLGTPQSNVTPQDMTMCLPVVITGTSATPICDCTSSPGTVIRAINVYSTDTSAQTMTVSITDGTTPVTLFTTSIPASAGNLTTGNVNLLSPQVWTIPGTDNAGNKYIEVPHGYKLQVQMTAVTATKAFHVVCINAETL